MGGDKLTRADKKEILDIVVPVIRAQIQRELALEYLKYRPLIICSS